MENPPDQSGTTLLNQLARVEYQFVSVKTKKNVVTDLLIKVKNRE